MEAEKKILHSAGVLRRYWAHTKLYPYLFGLGLAGVVVQQMVYVISALYLRDFINLVATLTPSPENYSLALAPLVIYGILGLIGWAGGRMEFFGGVTMIIHVSKRLTEEAYNYLMRHSHQYFSSSFAGALTRRVTKYRDSYERLYYSLQTSIVPASLYIVGATAVLFFSDTLLGTILFVWVTVFIGIQWILVRWQRPLRVKRATEDSNVTAVIADAVSNQNTAILFSGNTYEEGLLKAAAEKLRIATARAWNFDLWFYGAQGLLAISANVGLLWVGLGLWEQGVLQVGDLVLIQTFVFGILNHVWGIGREFRTIYTVLADASEMVEILDTPHEIQDKHGAKKLKVTKGEVWFDDVSFHFHAETSILSQFNLTIAGGEKIALVGPSGAGKSTITKLLLRLYDVQGGAVKIDGQNIVDVTQDSLRELIAFVPQEPILFHRTLMENIRYGRRDATDEQVIAAAKKAHCHEFISKLPLGYDTFVGERGIKLSGGERQRVAIARAMLKNAPILVLDEATSSLDSESEQFIQQALEVLMQGKTVIVIAHRLSTIMKMDRIVVMEEGRIAATGTHLELVNQRGLYQKLWSIQVGGFIGEDVAPEEEPETLPEVPIQVSAPKPRARKPSVKKKKVVVVPEPATPKPKKRAAPKRKKREAKTAELAVEPQQE